MNPRDAKVCIRDSGLFLSIARAYGRQFNTPPFYSTPWEKQFADGEGLQIGDGYPELQRVRCMEEVEDQCDLFIFLDIGDGYKADRLRAQGKRVFGAGVRAEELESKRWHFYKTVKDLGMPVTPAERVIGISALRKHLATHDNRWVKISQFRGIEETFYSENYLIIFPFLDWLESELGARREVVEFVSFVPIENAREVGYDGWSFNGKFPKQAFWGYERKGKSYVLTGCDYEDLPEEVKYVNEMFAPVLERVGYCGHFHTEARVTEDGKVHFTDPTMRPGSPPGEIFAGMISNLAEIAYHGAAGEVVEPIPAYQFGVQAVISSPFAQRNAITVSYPEEIADRVMLLNSCIDPQGIEWVTPMDARSPEIGFVTGGSDDLAEAIAQAQEAAKEFKAFRVDIDVDEIALAIKEVEKGQEEGMKFTDQPLPTPEEMTE